MREASIFANEEWLTVPFSDRPKTVFDRIIDVLIRLPLCAPHLGSSFLSKNSPVGSRPESILDMELKRLKDELDMLWYDLRMKASSHGWDGDFFQGKFGFDFNHPTSTTDRGTEKDAFTSAIIALYNTARIIVLSLFAQIRTPLILSDEQITVHSASILHAAEFLHEHDIGCAYIRLLLPLKVVGLLSPETTHRERARTLLETWRQRSGMKGICEVVLSEMDKES